MKTNEIRQKFLDFFISKSHTVVESSSLIPANDQSLLFTNAGMVQFKDVFCGKETKSYTRAASIQKCLRAGGKHNDLEQVGYTARHHTFFEMLGNFSFGDYFKQEAISYAWEFITDILNLPTEHLYVSIYKDDDEAYNIWNKHIGLPTEKIFRFDEKDNFWSMGDTGPCGPCSEIFIDRGKKYGCSKPTCTVGCNCDRYIEFWNLVFMQYYKDENAILHPLPHPSIDTGAGLERLASILQKVDTNYDIDIFQNILHKTCELLSTSYETIKHSQLVIPYRVISDHARAITFLIADGVMPSNEGRGYVLRRIIRRAIRYGKKIGFNKEFLYKICDFVIEQMSDAYPYLTQHKQTIQKCVLREESLFLSTLENGLNYLENQITQLLSSNKNILKGEIAFKLYDTYGFPLDLTELIAKERNIKIDHIEFENLMKEQQKRSKQTLKTKDIKELNIIYDKLKDQIKHKNIKTKFCGYEKLLHESKCLLITESNHNDILYVIFESTPFYAESGGQIADTGKIYSIDHSFEANVLDVQKLVSNVILIKIKVIKGEIKENEQYIQKVNTNKRIPTMKNHSATHLLQWALRTTLGSHVQQAGSLVTDEYLRFDFTHFQKLTKEELDTVENLINEKIWQAIPLNFKYMKKDEAIKQGAIAFFDEKYEDIVRVVNIGDFSIELCGGTHVQNTSEINLFKIKSETSIASGIRRIIALTSKNAFTYLKDQYQISDAIKLYLKANTKDEIIMKLQKLENTEKELKKELSNIEQILQKQQINELIQKATLIKDNIKFIVTIIDYDKKEISKLRDMASVITNKCPHMICVLLMKNYQKNKIWCTVSVGSKLQNKINASIILKQLCQYIDGKGGGKADLAQGSGSNPNGAIKILHETKNIILQYL